MPKGSDVLKGRVEVAIPGAVVPVYLSIPSLIFPAQLSSYRISLVETGENT